MAKALIASAYGKPPDRSYFGGCSNGGRHTFVAMTRMPEEYDGYLAGAPGYRLPLAAIANQFGAQAVRDDLDGPVRPQHGLHLQRTRGRVRCGPAPVRRPRRCRRRNHPGHDGLPGSLQVRSRRADVQRRSRRDLPVCGAEGGHCADLFGSGRGDGAAFYASFPFDSGHASRDSSFWEFFVPLRIDSAATAMIWGVPPADPSTFDGAAYALSTPIDKMLAAVAATDATYTESALSFMQPVNPTDLAVLRDRGAKVIVYHGVSDAIFSVNDTTTWYEGLQPTTAATPRASRASSECPAWPIAAAGRRPTSSTC